MERNDLLFTSMIPACVVVLVYGEVVSLGILFAVLKTFGNPLGNWIGMLPVLEFVLFYKFLSFFWAVCFVTHQTQSTACSTMSMRFGIGMSQSPEQRWA